MEKVTLEVQTRELKAVADALRSQKLIPAVFYGKGEKNIHLQVDYQTFRRLYINSGSQLIDLLIDGKTNKKALVHDLQFDPLSGKITHIDFLRVSLKEAVTTEVEIELIGVAPAVKDLGGVLNQIKDVVEIKCLPTDIPKVIQVDISGLTEFNSAIHVNELPVPKDVTILDVPDDVVVIVNAPRVEEEESSAGAVISAEGASVTAEAGAEATAEEKKDE